MKIELVFVKCLEQYVVYECHSVVSDFATSWTVAYQAPLSMEFSRTEYWTGWLISSPSRINPGSPALQADSLPAALSGKPYAVYRQCQISVYYYLEQL